MATTNKIAKYKCFYITPSIDKEFFANCWNRSSMNNSLFRLDEESGNLYFVSQYKNEVQFMFEPQLIDIFNEDFFNKVINIINCAHQKATLLKTFNVEEPTDYSLQHEGELESLVHSAITKVQYEQYGILKFVSYIIFRIATKQIWKNANKRTAIVSAASLFEIFGLYLVFRSKQIDYLEHWRQFMVSIGKRYENMRQNISKYDSEDKILQDIANKFERSLYIDANFIK